jgi:hypothetical protein
MKKQKSSADLPQTRPPTFGLAARFLLGRPAIGPISHRSNKRFAFPLIFSDLQQRRFNA